jgi:sugar/nucleoside kinase (ribokinase family)
VPQVDLLAVGEAFEDLIFVDLPRLPRPGEEVKTSTFVRTVGGGAVITAVAAARLGLRVRVMSGLSPLAEDVLRKERVTTCNLRRTDESPAISAALSTPTNRSFVTFNGVNDVLEPRLLSAISRVTARHVHLALFPHDCARWLKVVRKLRSEGITTSWDFGWNEGLRKDRGFPSLGAAVDFLMLNEQETVLYSGARRFDEAVRLWKQRARTVIIKRGPRGSRWISGTEEIDVPGTRVKVVDTTGAGDAFNGGFLYAWLRDMPPRACLRVANQVGACSTQAAGGLGGLPHLDDLS